jgi:hypothetical protein
VSVLDAIVESLDEEAVLARLRDTRPEVVVSLVGEACWDEDRKFLTRLKAETQAYIVGIGDVLLENTEERLAEAPGLEAALLNFATRDVLTLLANPAGQPVANVVYRGGKDGVFISGGLRKLQGEFRIPKPRHELFPLWRYRFPFMMTHPMTTVLTDYGCPFTCSFCVIASLGFGLRPLSEVVEELDSLKTLGVREVFFLDQTFGVNRERTFQLCQIMREHELQFKWSCFSRADVLTLELLQAMAKSGCHTIIFGVESGSDATLARYHKKMNLRKIRETLAACRGLRIRVAATFMLGLPGETEADVRRTIGLALELPIDYVSFNVPVPRPGTGLRREALEAGLTSLAVQGLDQSGQEEAMATKELSSEKILNLRREALRRFYLRPGYILRRLLTLRSWWDFRTQVADGLGVLADALIKRSPVRRTEEQSAMSKELGSQQGPGDVR